MDFGSIEEVVDFAIEKDVCRNDTDVISLGLLFCNACHTVRNNGTMIHKSLPSL